jgi:hypothetical protein
MCAINITARCRKVEEESLEIQNYMLKNQIKYLMARVDEEVHLKLQYHESEEYYRKIYESEAEECGFWKAQAEFFEDRLEDMKIDALAL